MAFDRRAWEEGLKGRPGLKGSRMLLLLVLLDIARGKPWAYPSDAYLAGKSKVSENTVWRSLRDLEAAGIVRTVKTQGRRWIVFPDHPHAAAFLAGLGVGGDTKPCEVGPPIPPDPSPEITAQAEAAAPQPEMAAPQPEMAAPQDGGRNVLVKRGSEVRVPACAEASPPEPEGTEISLPGPNERTTEGEPPPPRSTPTPKPPAPAGQRRRGLPNLAGAPADDPIIAAELARLARAREAVAAPSREEILALALGEAGVGAAMPVPASGPVVCDDRPAAVSDGRGSNDPEAATIEALAKLGPGATRGEVLAATLRLTALFRDPGSRAYYRSVCNEVARGQLPARIPIAAVGSARGSGIRNPGAAFTAHVGRCRATAEARRARPSGP